MNLQIFFAAVSSLIGLVSFVPYIRDTLHRKTQPHSYTWLIWTILQTTGVIAMIKGGAGVGAASLALGAIFCGFIWVLSLRYGTHNIKTFDKICLSGALIAVGLYFLLNNALLSVILVSLTDFIAFLPTWRKAYAEPGTETISTYVLSSTSSIFAVTALATISLTTSLYLISLVITNAICAGIIIIRRKKLLSTRIS